MIVSAAEGMEELSAVAVYMMYWMRHFRHSIMEPDSIDKRMSIHLKLN